MRSIFIFHSSSHRGEAKAHFINYVTENESIGDICRDSEYCLSVVVSSLSLCLCVSSCCVCVLRSKIFGFFPSEGQQFLFCFFVFFSFLKYKITTWWEGSRVGLAGFLEKKQRKKKKKKGRHLRRRCEFFFSFCRFTCGISFFVSTYCPAIIVLLAMPIEIEQGTSSTF